MEATDNTHRPLRFFELDLQSIGRCPRCGYVIGYDGYRYYCAFCGYLHSRRKLEDTIQDLERTLKFKVHNFLAGFRRPPPQQVVTYYPVTTRPCVACGILLPIAAYTCPACGASQFVSPQTPSPRMPSPAPPTRDQRVLDYIVAHNGTISISQAARDLSMSPQALRSTVERLKSAGFLTQA